MSSNVEDFFNQFQNMIDQIKPKNNAPIIPLMPNPIRKPFLVKNFIN